jgi:hypothetical protein
MNAAKPEVAVKGKKATAKKHKRGAEKMREEADKVVGRDCKSLIEALSENGQKGLMQSAKFLYSLAHSAEELDEDGDGAHKFRSMAMELASSPEWKSNSAEEKPHEEEGDAAPSINNSEPDFRAASLNQR